MIKQWMSLGRKVWLSNFYKLQAPYKLTYAVTGRCNSRCRHCLVWKQKPANELTLDEIARFAHNNSQWSWIDFTGGEPTLRSDFVDIVRVFLKTNSDLIFIHFPTNGLQTDRIIETCEGILALSPPRLVVTVSIDGPPEIHDTIRGVQDGFSRACRTLAALRGISGLSVHVGLTLYPDNIGEIDRTIEALRETIPGFNLRQLHVNIPHASDHFYHNAAGNPRATPEMMNAIRNFTRRRGMPRSPFEWVEWLYQKNIPAYIATGKCPRNCAALLSSCFLGPDGTVYPCSIWNMPLGNIRATEYRLDQLIRSERTRQLRSQLLRKECQNCWTPCEAYPTLAANLLHWRPPS